MALDANRWTLAELYGMPDDGNTYELIDGELFVSPAPEYAHEIVLARLRRILEPYVITHGLGLIFSRGVFEVGERFHVEPDLAVALPHAGPNPSWGTAPVPSLVVEVESTGRESYDRVTKRAVYMENGIPEYWIVDRQARSIRVCRINQVVDVIESEVLVWLPTGAAEALTLQISQFFA